MKTIVTDTPIVCPRWINEVDPDCPACEGEGVVIETETITEDGWCGIVYSPLGNPCTPPTVPSIPSPGIYPYITYTNWCDPY